MIFFNKKHKTIKIISLILILITTALVGYMAYDTNKFENYKAKYIECEKAQIRVSNPDNLHYLQSYSPPPDGFIYKQWQKDPNFACAL